MKVHPLVFLLALILLACSMPGLDNSASDSGKAKTDNVTGSPANQPSIITPSSAAEIRPTLTTSYPVITDENVEKLTVIHSIPFKNISKIFWQPDSQSLTAIQPQTVTRFDAANLNVTETISLPETSTLLDYDAESRQILLTGDRRHLDIGSLDGKKAMTILLS